MSGRKKRLIRKAQRLVHVRSHVHKTHAKDKQEAIAITEAPGLFETSEQILADAILTTYYKAVQCSAILPHCKTATLEAK